ncbi:hypothetical protein N7489_010757 [Penicillium chrysogenum]|uniref:Uncharacterized protein n=1 Tax=Penicillium chrysogenum TaxID=5076 RepID=A0ABQ8WSP6_PENCH|nr:uncharacterized protein N7489_010757 [Penicillium chrysogenum]KAJ5230049.1 hypothetical protein N7489_010757 [Penicillium chrysogenum]KAJ5282059.1 hypothetical protein N7505_000039 [Penicillium chrysogenum]KAJ6140980.1 hypothetical protein N7497_011873 [Penicillium chrysogenum]
MGRSMFSGRSKPVDPQFGWYFAGEPMDKRHSRSRGIRLVRYGPEIEPCAHSRCPSPSPITENTPCTCTNTCELRSHGTRSQSQSDSYSSVSESVIVCCGGCHAIRREPGPSPQVEKVICLCECHSRETLPIIPSSSGYSSSESATKRYGSRHSTRHERRSNDTRPTTPNSSDFSDYELPKRRRGHRISTREPERHLQLEKFHGEGHTPPPSTTATPGQRYHSPRASLVTAPRAGPVIQRHCRKASYCERHPELCRATIPVPSPVPRPTPTPTRSPRSIEKPQHKPRAKPEPKRTYTQAVSPPKRTPSAKPVPSPKPICPRHGAQNCGCVYMDGYRADDSSYYAPYDDDTVSETSIQAMPDHDRVDETRCTFHHRCRPKFECGVGWVCGRK